MILALLGATASGKSGLAKELAKEFSLAIVNADPFQTYRGMELFTAAPNEEDKAEVRHLLYSIQTPDVAYDAPTYQRDARRTINELESEGMTPLFVGGSGLYMRAALYRYEFPVEVKKPDMKPYFEKSDGDLHRILEELDPKEAAKLHPNNRRRVLRAIEICLSTGSRKSDLIPEKNEPVPDAHFLWLKIPREEIYSRIDKRVDEMVENGLVDVLKGLVDEYGYDVPGFKAIGAKEMFPYLKGECSLEEAVASLKKATRNYVKRQETFFRHQFDATIVTNKEEAFDAVRKILSR